MDHGANPNAYVLKLKQWREELVPSELKLSQVSQSTQAQIAVQARRPPEKDQYINENLGLCNAVHLLLEQKTS